MTIQVGDTLPSADLLMWGADGPETVDLGERIAGKKILIVGMPGAFTNTCTALHMPSIVAQADAIRAKGVDEIIVLVVNDAQVIRAWGEATGATDAGVTILGDPTSAYVKEVGLAFDAPPAGFYGRSVRHVMLVEDGVVARLDLEEARTTCDMTGGEAILDFL
ncbi:MAG: peroxiredoxin [Pseudomonadota bacterium]